MLLSLFLDTYAQHRDIADSTLKQYQFVILSFSRALDHPAKLSDLSADNVNGWLRSMQQAGQSPHTCKSSRMTILSVWNLATQLDMIPRHGNVRGIRTPDLIIKTLTSEQVAAIRDCCDRLRGRWHKLTIAGYMRTFVDATLETSLRQSDLHRIPLSCICEQPIQLIQKKTGYRRLAIFSESLIARILHWHNGDQLIWPRHSKTLVATRLRILGEQLKIVGLTHTMLRKTAISDVEAQAPGSGWIFAGHRSPSTTQAWYTDRQQQYCGLPKPRL